MVNKYSKAKAKQLGMPHGTAANRLRKMILFSLVQETKKDVCFQCSKKIENIDNLSIEHKIPWLGNDSKLFWDLDNIAFSHLRCNAGAARKPTKIEWPEGKAWCSKCKSFKDLEKGFANCKKYRKSDFCTKCNTERMELQRQKYGRKKYN